MGQLCCFHFCRSEEKNGEKDGREPDEEELVSLSKRLVETAVIKAVQQYIEETQTKPKQGKTNGEQNTSVSKKSDTDNDKK
eukprot:gi/632962639/ref/XP_007897433.1/ PREDICTED: A-kinase anchor protein 7 isoform alpha-like [Callorhinchus milii]